LRTRAGDACSFSDLWGFLCGWVSSAESPLFFEGSHLAQRPTFTAALQPIIGGLLVVLVGGALVELFIYQARVRSATRPSETLGAVLSGARGQLFRRPAISVAFTLMGAIGFALPTALFSFLGRLFAEPAAISTWNFAVLIVAHAVTTLLRSTVSMFVLAAATDDD
jgi:hypothetical protein